MMDFVRNHQLNIMLILSSVCGTITAFVLITKAITKERRRCLLLLEFASMLLLAFDRLAYMYSGDQSSVGYVMVRLTNFIVFSMTLVVILALNFYIIDLLKDEGGLKETPFLLKMVTLFLVIGILLIIFSQFTGLYYTFDENNEYHRAPGFIICYVFPLIAPLLQLVVIIMHRKRIHKGIWISLLLFIIVPIIASIIQIFAYGLSLTNICIVGVAVLAYIIALYDINIKLDHAKKVEIQYYQDEAKALQNLFEQTATAFVDAIDAKDIYTDGHSVRVATYARMIAEKAGKSEKECDEIYYTALLHDVGKIDIPDSILQNDGNLTDEEYKKWKEKSIIGDQILSNIEDYPFLRVGAHYVHERYDGSGYPDKLIGQEIPEYARIIAVADYYDSITSKKRYRDSYPQPFVREEFVKGSGIKFDPKYAEIMIEMIDSDVDFSMRENKEDKDITLEKEFPVSHYRSKISKGILAESTITEISFRFQKDNDTESGFSTPALIVFDSYDGRAHDEERTIKAFHYLEYGEVWFDGRIIDTRARSMKVKALEEKELPPDRKENSKGELYRITVFRYEDHVKLITSAIGKKYEVTIALPESSKYAFIGITGEYGYINEIEVKDTGVEAKETDIERIAPKFDYTNRLEGDIPNVQIDRNRKSASEPIPVTDDMRIIFHTMSLPSSNLVWHCPYILLYYSDDKKIGGENYREFALIKLNGECESKDDRTENVIRAVKSGAFTNWEAWKEKNRKGMSCEASFMVKGNEIITSVENGGISIENSTVISDPPEVIYAALTGDRCVLTNIRIS